MYARVQGRASDLPAHTQFLGILWVALGCVPLYMEKHTAGKGHFMNGGIFCVRWKYVSVKIKFGPKIVTMCIVLSRVVIQKSYRALKASS